MVSDPLVLLQFGEMRCGHVARVAVDLFSAAGYQARLVQLGGHVIAEVYYGQNWHYFDADLFKGGQCVFNPDGSIPSVDQLSQIALPDRFAGRPILGRLLPTSADDFSRVCPSYCYFSQQAWNAQFPAGKSPAPYVVYKTATAAQVQYSIYYGWNDYTEVATPDRILYNMPMYYTPGAPQIQSVQTQLQADGSLSVTIGWSRRPTPAAAWATMLWSPRLAAAGTMTARACPASLMSLKSSNVPWNPSMYIGPFHLAEIERALRRRRPPRRRRCSSPIRAHTSSPSCRFDAHDASVGRTLYYESEEICIKA